MKTSGNITLNINRGEARDIALSLPVETLTDLENVAERRDMSLQALLKFYIGRGLRQDLAKIRDNDVIEMRKSNVPKT